MSLPFSEKSPRPEAFPEELDRSIDAANPGIDMIASVVKGLGPLVLRVPTAAIIDAHAEYAKKFTARQAADLALLGEPVSGAPGCLVYPERAVFEAHLQSRPNAGAALWETLEQKSLGVDMERFSLESYGAASVTIADNPPDWCKDAILTARTKVGALPQFNQRTDALHAIPTEFGAIVVRTPTGGTLDFRDSKPQSRERDDSFVRACLLHPDPLIMNAQWFARRPLMGRWMDRLLMQFATGDIEVHAGF